MRFTQAEKTLIDKMSKVNDYEYHLANIKDELNKLHETVESKIANLREVEQGIAKIVEEKSKGFPWISDVIAGYLEARDLKIAEFLDNKLRPGVASAARVREIAKEKRILKKELLITKSFIKYYEALFPWLQDYIDEDLDSILLQVQKAEQERDEEKDPVEMYVTPAQYKSLSSTERNQLALDRYWKRNKSSWEIGRVYERYIGYQYEKQGYKVQYQGIEKGLEDLGRDLICTRNGEIEIIQCKYWSKLKNKKIHEKHINQLFGTTVKYIIDEQKTKKQDHFALFPVLLKSTNIKAKIVTSVELTPTAKEFAEALGIEISENYELKDYPCIKCNISKLNGERIYHLPFDQQYDSTIIEYDQGEFYANTVAEAEEKGFRRAWRWHGDALE